MGSSDSDTETDTDVDAADSVDAAEAASSTGRTHSGTAAIAAVLAVVLVGSSLLARPQSIGDLIVAAGAVALVTLLAGALLWRLWSGGSDGGESDVWSAIPSWQYDGRHAESGGLTRGEQESALRDIQRQADELEQRERN